MKITGSSVLHAPAARVWEAINDPAVLAGVIPGCDRFTEIADGHFGMTVSLGVAAIKGSYTGEVRLTDRQEPRSLTMHAQGSGGPGTIDTTVAVSLTDNDDGTTRLDYDADAVVGGMVGGVGQRVLTGVAKKTAGMFFSAIDDVLTGKRAPGRAPEKSAAAAVPVDGAGAVGHTVGGVAVPAVAGQAVVGQRWLPLAVAAAFGAASALVGVVVGAVIGARLRH